MSSAAFAPILLTPDKTRFQPLGLFKRSPTSIVSLVQDLSSREKRVARWLKQPATVSEGDFLEALDRLARTLGKLSHPAVTRFDRLVEGQGGTWMLFHYVEGVPLLDYLGAEASVPDGWIVWWLHHIVEALESLHAHLVIGYLEPADILVAADRIVLCDVGIFEHVCPEHAARAMSSHPYIDFVAPEKRSSAASLPAADLFSAGAVAFWLATSCSPAVGPGVSDRLLSALQEHRPGLPLAVAELIVQLLSYHPGDRPAAAAARESLRPSMGDLQGQEPPSPPPLEALQLRAATTVSMEPHTAPVRVPRRIVDSPPSAPDEAPPGRSSAVPRPWGVAALVGLLATVWWARHLTGAAPLMTLRSGTAFRPGVRLSGGRREVASTLGKGEGLVAGPDGAVLTLDRSTLWLDPGTTVTCGGEAHGAVTLTLQGGRLRVLSRAGNSVHVGLRAADLTIPPGTDLVAELAPNSHFVITCKVGTTTLLSGSGEQPRTLTAGQKLEL